MLEARQRYRAALEAAGPDFLTSNPGQHYFYADSPDRVCVFCGCSEDAATQGERAVACPGDRRRGV